MSPTLKPTRALLRLRKLQIAANTIKAEIAALDRRYWYIRWQIDQCQRNGTIVEPASLPIEVLDDFDNGSILEEEHATGNW